MKCEYCENKEVKNVLFKTKSNNEGFANVLIEEGKLKIKSGLLKTYFPSLSNYDTNIEVEINYCPECGRKLK